MNKLISYFKKEKKSLLIVTVTGLIYNVGLLAGPYFEGRMSGTLVDILKGNDTFPSMLQLVCLYLFSIVLVQTCRYCKRNYVRIFANNTNRRMKETLYRQLLTMPEKDLEKEGIGNILTKALNDVDDCSEGMRKFTTEVFDTGISLISYIAMLLYYDFKLALLCIVFTLVSFSIAEKMKTVVQKTSIQYKIISAALSEETLDRGENELTYRVYGREECRAEDYENVLKKYETASVISSLPVVALPPLYKLITCISVICIVYFGSKNVLNGIWTIASFTTFLSCFMKMADKSSKSAKLFNAVHKAQVSWNRIETYMNEDTKLPERKTIDIHSLSFENVSFHYPDSPYLFQNVSFSLSKGQIIGITGKIACGKSTLGKLLLNTLPYEGRILVNGTDLKELPEDSSFLTYYGHDTQLFNDTIENNIALGKKVDVHKYLKMVDFDEEVNEMENGIHTIIGDKGSQLSGGQAQRLGLARTLAHAKSVLVLDDPFSSLDTETENTIFHNIRKAFPDTAILLISHRLHLFVKMDKVLFMYEKQCNAGTHTSLLQSCEGYRNLFEMKGDDKNA